MLLWYTLQLTTYLGTLGKYGGTLLTRTSYEHNQHTYILSQLSSFFLSSFRSHLPCLSVYLSTTGPVQSSLSVLSDLVWLTVCQLSLYLEPTWTIARYGNPQRSSTAYLSVCLHYTTWKSSIITMGINHRPDNSHLQSFHLSKTIVSNDFRHNGP